MMAFVDARRLRPAHRIEADLCVIGSGAAGLAIAERFFGSSTKLAVLESGGEEPDEETQRLYEGRSIGQTHEPLHTSRLRYYGGTTNHWTAHVRSLDAIDFERRAWVPHSGWPIGLHDLEPYYEQARVFLGLPDRPFDVAEWSRPDRQPWAFEEDRVQSRVRQMVPEKNRRLGTILRSEMASSSNVDTYLYANVLGIELAEGRRQVRRLALSTLAGTRFTAHARAFVLATGGIENPRILLLSEVGTNPDPLKNRVGRYFSNHPATDIAELQLDSTQPGAAFYRQGTKHPSGWALPFLTLSAATQRRFKLLNTWLQLTQRLRFPGMSPHRGARLDSQIAKLALDMDGLEAGEDTKQRRTGQKLVLL